jgi:hypothetical protein
MTCHGALCTVNLFSWQSQALSSSFLISCHVVHQKLLVLDHMLVTSGANFVNYKIGCKVELKCSGI